jgi:hypothetical protein
MRRILIETARRKQGPRQGGRLRRIEADLNLVPAQAPPEDLLALDEALSKLAQESPARAELVKLRFFAGLTVPEAAEILGISRATAERYWTYARTWLYAELSGAEDLPPSPDLSRGKMPGRGKNQTHVVLDAEGCPVVAHIVECRAEPGAAKGLHETIFPWSVGVGVPTEPAGRHPDIQRDREGLGVEVAVEAAAVVFHQDEVRGDLAAGSPGQVAEQGAVRGGEPDPECAAVRSEKGLAIVVTAAASRFCMKLRLTGAAAGELRVRRPKEVFTWRMSAQ